MIKGHTLTDWKILEFEALAATIPDIVYKIGENGKFTYLNPAIRKLGYEPNELIGKHFSEIISPADVKKVSREYVLPECSGKTITDTPKLFDERRSFSRKTAKLEIRIILKESSKICRGVLESISQKYIVAEVSSAGLYQGSGDGNEKVFIGTVGVIKDVSSQRWMEAELIKYAGHLQELVANRTEDLKKNNEQLQQLVAELKESENLSSTILEKTPIGVYIIQDGIIKYVNAPFTKTLNCLREHLIGKQPLDLVLPDDRDRVRQHAIQMLKHNNHNACEFRVTDMDGNLKWVMDTVVSIQYHGKQAALGIFLDITERKQSEEKLRENHEQSRKTLDGITHAIAATIELRDPYTAGHQTRVAHLAQAIAREMNFPEEMCSQIYTAGLIHDIGKICIPAEILSKPGDLNAIEHSLIKLHSQAGYDILKNIDFPYPIARWVLEHHELLDGSGYPVGLTGDQISPQARILTVADVLEAMSSHRPYRASLGMNKALTELKTNKNKLYDGNVVDACIRLFKEKGFKL
jgi:PAS domain S-box-containing protein/putative nucleotidyltransferase with HDIG domain